MTVTLVCFRGGPFAEEAAALGIDTRVFAGGFFHALREVRALIAAEGCDIIHCHGSRANLAGALLRMSTRKPVVSTVHSDYRLDYLGRPAAALTYGKLNVFALRHIKYHIGVSDAMRALLISRGFPRATTFAIYNGLDFSRSVPQPDRAAFYARVGANVGPGDVVVGAAARLDPVKDLSTLVRGFALAKKSVPGLKLIIAGEGAERPVLESLARELGVEDSITLAGWLDDMDEYYGSLDINALSSISETFPYAITEGAAHRLPTVSSRVGGIPSPHRGRRHRLSSSSLATGRRWASAWRAWPPTPPCARPWARPIFERAARDFSMEATCHEQRAVYEEILSREANGGRRGRPHLRGLRHGQRRRRGHPGRHHGGDALHRPADAQSPSLSRDPEGAEARLDVDAIHTFNVPGFLRAMRRRRLYINGGGSLIQDVTSRRSLWFYLFTLRAARRCGCRVMMYGCGIGPRTPSRRRQEHAPHHQLLRGTSSRCASRTAWRSCTASACRARS